MKRQLLTCCLAMCSLATMAQHDEWKNPEINAVNRAPMHTNYFAYSSSEEAAKADKENSSNFMTLNGIWKFNWVKNADARPTDFYRTDYNDKGWGQMKVPGVWEMNGYGDPIYVNVGYAWRSQYKNNPPYVPIEKQPCRIVSQRNHYSCRMVRKRNIRPLWFGHFKHVSMGQR